MEVYTKNICMKNNCNCSLKFLMYGSSISNLTIIERNMTMLGRMSKSTGECREQSNIRGSKWLFWSFLYIFTNNMNFAQFSFLLQKNVSWTITPISFSTRYIIRGVDQGVRDFLNFLPLNVKRNTAPIDNYPSVTDKVSARCVI